MLADVLKTRIDSIAQVDPGKAIELREIVRASNRGLLGRDAAAKQMAEILGVDHEEILSSADNGEVKNEQLAEFIKTLRPDFKLAMLSNVRSRERVEQRFNTGELDELFDDVVASGDVGFIKPEREIYELTAARLGVQPEECVMIDDIREFCDGAEAVGMRAIQFTSTDQAINDLTALIDSEKERY